jgi:hypothetical protein
MRTKRQMWALLNMETERGRTRRSRSRRRRKRM